jgi:ribonuclease I
MRANPLVAQYFHGACAYSSAQEYFASGCHFVLTAAMMLKLCAPDVDLLNPGSRLDALDINCVLIYYQFILSFSFYATGTKPQ